MLLEDSLQKIIIIDFGSQFTQLIARKIRELGIYCEIISHNKITKNYKLERNVKGLILSGGPLNVYQSKKVKFNKNLLFANIPVLGICFGHQIISKEMGGKVKQSKSREFGLAKVIKIKKGRLSPDYKSKNIIGYEKDVKLQWNTENISKTGIIGNPINANSLKGEKLAKITISTIEKIIKELKLL